MKINSIIPANGWSAIYETDESTIAKPLAFWGLISSFVGDSEINVIHGFVIGDNGDIIKANDYDGVFKTYEHDIDNALIDYLAIKNND